jgi:hypothetical protein
MLVDGSIGAFNHQDGIAYLDAVHIAADFVDGDLITLSVTAPPPVRGREQVDIRTNRQRKAIPDGLSGPLFPYKHCSLVKNVQLDLGEQSRAIPIFSPSRR